MRIITGSARGKRLQTPSGLHTRPTTDRVKESVFSALQFEIEGRAVLDLFAGSGQMGLEALSRGATACTFVDSSKDACDVVRTNAKATRLADRARIVNSDAQRFCDGCHERFDVVFLDPPYAAGLLEGALTAAARLLNAGGFVVCESDERAELPETVEGLTLYRSYRYSHVKLWIYR